MTERRSRTVQTGKPTKLPRKPFTVVADDLEIEEDGETYRPHAGENVTFRGRMTVGDYLNALSLASFDETHLEGADAVFDEMLENLALRIVSWDWTGDYNESLPPPTPKVLRGLSFEELSWLIQKANGARTAEQSKNGSTPST